MRRLTFVALVVSCLTSAAAMYRVRGLEKQVHRLTCRRGPDHPVVISWVGESVAAREFGTINIGGYSEIPHGNYRLVPYVIYDAPICEDP